MMNTVVSTSAFRPAHQRVRQSTKNTQDPKHSFGRKPLLFQGKTERSLGSKIKESSKAIHSLFDQPGKNMFWSVGYGLGGLLLIPIMPIAVGAFCLAGVHLVSASYQFFHEKPDEHAGKDAVGKSSTKALSIHA